MSETRAYSWLHRVWYEDASFGWLLLPLSGLYWLVIVIRKYLYDRGILSSDRAAVPVVVVGNITAGGTGKTPTVLWLAAELQKRGFAPGIVSRGYGGSHSGSSMRVAADSKASIVGDEPVLLARRSGCPVVIDPDRARAATMLIADGVDVVISDDGLQHYRLQRDYEICVVDGRRGLGNRRLLPAGPLREPAERLDDVEQALTVPVYGAERAPELMAWLATHRAAEGQDRIDLLLDAEQHQPLGEQWQALSSLATRSNRCSSRRGAEAIPARLAPASHSRPFARSRQAAASSSMSRRSFSRGRFITMISASG